MNIIKTVVAIFCLATLGLAAEPAQRQKVQAEQRQNVAVCLAANDLSIATGKPSLVMMSNGSVQIPVWSLSGGTVGQSVAGLVGGLPGDCEAVKVEIVVTSTDATTSQDFEDVYRVHLSQMVDQSAFTEHYYRSSPTRTTLPTASLHTRTILLESYYPVKPDAPLWVRIQREPGDPADTFIRPMGLAMVKVTPVPEVKSSLVVQDVSGYNSWPMMQAIGDKLVCTYSRGKAHSIGEDARAVYARTSTDGGRTWTAETVVADTPKFGEVTVGKGLDRDGAMLLWVRRVGSTWHHDLYRTKDGVTFDLLATPQLKTRPVQITDIFAVPQVGLMALWFGGDYGGKPTNSWGTVTSSDNGATWTQQTVESNLPKDQWPTEPAAVYLGDGRILGIARTERGDPTTERAQFQLESIDHGKTWTRSQTNITDVMASTPSLILDKHSGLLSNYYYQRGQGGNLRRRVVDPEVVFGHPLRWPASETIARGSEVTFDAGNVNATLIGDKHYLAFYSGRSPDTAVLVATAPAPKIANGPRASNHLSFSDAGNER